MLDIESGDYEVDDEDLVASERLLARSPDAKLYGLRVGYDYAYRLRGMTLSLLGESAPRTAASWS